MAPRNRGQEKSFSLGEAAHLFNPSPSFPGLIRGRTWHRSVRLRRRSVAGLRGAVPSASLDKGVAV